MYIQIFIYFNTIFALILATGTMTHWYHTQIKLPIPHDINYKDVMIRGFILAVFLSMAFILYFIGSPLVIIDMLISGIVKKIKNRRNK